MIKFTRKEIDELNDEQLKNLIMCTNDGQGDTSVRSVYESMGWYEPEYTKGTTSEFIDVLWSDTNGNMTEFIYVENNTWNKVRFVD